MANEPHLHTQQDPIDESHVRGAFATRLGFLLAAVGSAVGLGNIWRFPYAMGQNGGAAFLLIYLVCIVFMGIPVMLAEFSLGRFGQTSAAGSYKKAAPGTYWWLNGFMGVIAGFVILSYYTVVAGWILRYFVIGSTEGFEQFKPEMAGERFGAFISETGEPLIYQVITMTLTGIIIFFGIEKGIERSSKYLMPLLLALLVVLMIRSLTLDGAGAGLEFMFKLDFSKVTRASWLAALGHAFFTLSVGMGVMITYGSYMDRRTHMGRMSVWVAATDTGIAILAGLVIFPAVFAMELNPGEGPSLIFITLPQVFAKMWMGDLIGTAFFFLVFIAALTSTISILEAIVTYMVDDVNIKRHLATAIACVLIFVVAIPNALSFGALSGVQIPRIGTIFDLMDFLSQAVMLPLGGFFICLFFAIRWGQQNALQAAAGEGHNAQHWLLRAWYWVLITIAPLAILVVLVGGIHDKFKDKDKPVPEQTEQVEESQ